ncbi:hypothetical protein Tco_1548705 [Tanacetum coccineum]
MGEDKAVHKELGDSLVRAATTASSLEAEQDSGNINKTQSKATLNGSSSLGTTLGGGPRGNILRSDEDRLKLDDLMALYGEEVFVPEQEVVVKDVNNVVSTAGDATTVSAATTTIAITTNATITTVDDITLAQALMEFKKYKNPRRKGNDGPVKPMKKKDQIRHDEETALKLQAEFDKEERLLRERAEKDKEANIALIEIWDDIQAMIDVDYQLAERLQAQEQEDLSIKENATLFQQLLEKRRK